MFTDIGGNTHQNDINALAASGVTVGCAAEPARYCPDTNTTRAQMATFLVRAQDLLSNQFPEDTTTIRHQADPSVCRPPGSSYITAGFPLPQWAIPSVGNVRVAVLFLDFPDTLATHSTRDDADSVLPPMEEYLEKSSYGKLDLEFVPFHRWLRSEHNSSSYLRTGIGGKTEFQYEVDAESVRLADPEFDFTGYAAVITVLPSSHYWGGNALGTIDTEEGSLSSLRLNTFPLSQTIYRWRWTGAHEFTHKASSSGGRSLVDGSGCVGLAIGGVVWA